MFFRRELWLYGQEIFTVRKGRYGAFVDGCPEALSDGLSHAGDRKEVAGFFSGGYGGHF